MDLAKINLGQTGGDKKGDPAREAFRKHNQNMDVIRDAMTGLPSAGDLADVVAQIPAISTIPAAIEGLIDNETVSPAGVKATLASTAQFLRKSSSGELSTFDSALVDHSGDDTAAASNSAIINQMLADLKGAGGGVLRLGRGQIVLNPLATLTNTNISVQGSGRRVSELFGKGTGPLFNITQNSQGYRTNLGGFSVFKWDDASSPDAAIKIFYPSASSSLTETISLTDIECRGVNGTTTYAALAAPSDAWNTRFSRLEFEGIAGDPDSATAAIAYRGKCTVSQVEDIKAFWCNSVIEYEAGHFSEGGRFFYLQAVATNHLLRMANAVGAPGLYVSQSHAETFKGGIYAVNVNQLQVTDVHLYKRLTSTEDWTGVWVEAQAGSVSPVTINGLMVQGFKGSTAGGVAVAVLASNVKGLAGDGNSFEGCDLGLDGVSSATGGQFAFTYKDVTVTSQNDTNIVVTATDAVAPAQLPDFLDFVDPSRLGQSTDTLAVQAAIDSGRPVYIARGATYETGKLTLQSGTRIYGGGTIKAVAGLNDYLVYGNNVTGASLEGVTLDCNSGAATYGVKVEGLDTDGVKVFGCTVKQPSLDTIYLRQGKNLQAFGNLLLQPGQHGITFDGGATEFIASDNIIRDPGGAGVIFSRCQNGSICGNIISDPGLYGDGISGYHYQNENVTIADNVIKTSINHGIHVGGQRIVVTDNVIDGAVNDGIFVAATSNGGTTGTREASVGCIVKGNAARNIGRSALEVIRFDSGVINGNNFTGSATIQARVRESNDNVINNNRFDTGPSAGLTLFGSKRNSLIGNRSRGHAGDGFRFDDETAVLSTTGVLVASTDNVIGLNVSDSDNRSFIEAGASDRNAFYLNTALNPTTSPALVRGGANSVFSNAPLVGSLIYDPPSLTTGTGAPIQTITVPGAAVGDFVSVSFTVALSGVLLTAWVSAADTVSVLFFNNSGGTRDLSAGTISVRVVSRI